MTYLAEANSLLTELEEDAWYYAPRGLGPSVHNAKSLLLKPAVYNYDAHVDAWVDYNVHLDRCPSYHICTMETCTCV